MPALGQSTHQNLLPLSVGNRWTFITSGQNPNANSQRYEWEIKGSYQVGEVTYFTLDRPLPCVEVTELGIGIDGIVMATVEGVDVTLYDFEMPSESVYHFYRSLGPYSDTIIDYHVRIYRNININTGLFSGQTAVSLRFDDPRAIDEEAAFTFIPNVGFASIQCGWGSMDLISANISGALVTSTDGENHSIPESQSFEAFPSPFQEELQVEYSANGFSTIELFDIVGRKVASKFSNCVRLTCREVLNTLALPGGFYLLSVSGSNQKRQSRIVFKQ